MTEKNEFRTTRGYELLERPENKITSSMEDYIEMILRISKMNNPVTVSLLAEHLQVKPSSVSKMNHKLMKLTLIETSYENKITLTEKGKELAQYFMYRHKTIEDFLIFLGNSNPLFETELIEHTITKQTVTDIEILLSYFKNYPKAKDQFMKYMYQEKKKQSLA